MLPEVFDFLHLTWKSSLQEHAICRADIISFVTGTNAICKKINAGSQGNNQTVLRVHCSLTETWSANTEKCSVATLLIFLPSYYSQPFQTTGSTSHSFRTYQSSAQFNCLLWYLNYEDWYDYSVMDSEVSTLRTHFDYQCEKTYWQDWRLTILRWDLFYKGAGTN